MSEIKADLYYTQNDEWVAVEGDSASVGITDYAQDSLNDIVYLELPEVGDSFAVEDEFGTVESVKAAAELYMPVGGEITAVNDELVDEPEAINEDPYGSWMIKIKMSDSSELSNLMNAEQYKAYLADR